MSKNEQTKPETSGEKANPIDAFVMPESVTLSEAGAVLIEHHDGFDWPGELTFACVNDYVHDANRHFEELQYLALGMIGDLEKERDKVKALECELGQFRIQLDHKTTLLASCELALEERDAKHYELKA